MTTEIYSSLIDVKVYAPFGTKPLNYAHIKKSDFAPDYDETGLLLVAGLMLENRQLDLLVINDVPFTQKALRTKAGKFVWKRYVDTAPWAFNNDILQEILTLEIN